MPESKLPSYLNPPVIETVLSVQFAPIEGWTIGHFGLFWSSVREHLPRIESHQPLPNEVEDLDSLRPTENQLKLAVGVPDPRCWFLDQNGQELLQVQRNRFTYNWRAISSDHKYPRYENLVRPQFIRFWESFETFLQEESLALPAVVQCEVTYVNIMPKGSGWDSVGDWGNMFNVLKKHPEHAFLPEPESGNFGFSYQLPDKLGRLRVTVNHAFRKNDGSEAVQLQLTARGRPKGSATQDVVDWLDVGRDWGVRGFDDMTTPESHELWGEE
ncbi:MAG: TIGR04255 family protein [Planctomycetaceae bacterium]